MQTEFTCGTLTAIWTKMSIKWQLTINYRLIGLIDQDGILVHFVESPPSFDSDMIIELAVLMNNIKRQYKQHANTTNA